MLNKKAVVIETGKGWAILLLSGGAYKRIKTNRYLEVGELYPYRSYSGAKYLAAAAMFLAVLWGSIDYYTVQAYAEVSSLELGLNRWGRVISVQAGNDEGQRIMSQVQVKNEPVETAVQKISQAAEKERPGRPGLVGKPVVKVHAKGRAKPELEGKILEKIDQGRKKATPVKNENDKKRDFKNKAKLQHSKLDDNFTKQPQPENPTMGNPERRKPEPGKSEINPGAGIMDTEKKLGQPKFDEDLPAANSKRAIQSVENQRKDNKDQIKSDNPESRDRIKKNKDNNHQGHNRKNDNNRKKKGEQ